MLKVFYFPQITKPKEKYVKLKKMPEEEMPYDKKTTLNRNTGIPLHELFFSVLKINKTVNCIQNIFKSIPWSLLYIGFEDFSFVFTESSVKDII